MKKNKTEINFNYILEKFATNKKRHSWSYGGVEYDYDRTSCQGNCDDYCRCTEIINTRITEINYNYIVKSITESVKDNVILTYCIDRIIRSSKLDEDDFEISTCRGYYGEEIDGVYLDQKKNDTIYNNLKQLENMSDIEKVKFVLTLEYGYLLDVIENTTEVSIKEIDLDKITFQQDYRKKINLDEDFYDEKFTLPRGIFIENGEAHRLIDGYHRIMKAKSIGMNKVDGIVVK